LPRAAKDSRTKKIVLESGSRDEPIAADQKRATA
jgi:hypothetical protein